MSWLRTNYHKFEKHLAASRSKFAVELPGSSADRTPTAQNEILLQGFEWHTPKCHWPRLTKSILILADIGITTIWLPPGCKANSPDGNGYDCYDLYDLGEFDQKYTLATKWGTREQLDELMAKAKDFGINIVWDAVINHKTAGDATEECWAVECDAGDRRIETCGPKKIETWTRFNFPGRHDKYSDFKWNAQHFNGIDWDQKAQKNAVYKIVDAPENLPRPGEHPNFRPKGWADDVDCIWGNADYLMFANIDFSNPEVRKELLRWGRWMVEEVGVNGFRLDAVPHISHMFLRHWIDTVKDAAQRQGHELFLLGEFLTHDLNKLTTWLDRMGAGVRAFDVPLLHAFAKLSWAKNRYEVDLRKVFRGTLIEQRPNNAVTFVTSHDTQAGQAVETPIDAWFKPLAHAFMLLRKDGLPCVFYGDLYGCQGPRAEPAACEGKLPLLIYCRKAFAYGHQTDHFDSRTAVSWMRHGTWDRPDGCAVIMSVGGATKIRMFVGADKFGQIWTDVLGNVAHKCVIDNKGYGKFACAGRSVSVFVWEGSEDREDMADCCNAEKFVMQV